MSEELKSALKRIINAGYQISSDGFDFLQTLNSDILESTISNALSKADKSIEDILFLDRDFFFTCTSKNQEQHKMFTGKGRIRPLASEYEAEIKVIGDKGESSVGDLDGFIEYFRNRFNKLDNILRRRMDMKDAITIKACEKMPLKSKIKIIGLVTSKRGSGNRLFIELEDSEDSITIMSSDQETVRKGLTILLDQVICVEGVKYKQDLIIANDFIWPDIPTKNPKKAEVPLCTAYLADIHVGSVYFEKEYFCRFIEWLNLNVGNTNSQLLASRVKYLIIAGDLVDGIGVYPDQMDELNIRDIREQYEEAARLLSNLPDYIEIIIIPGNHDAVRKSLPQPAIPRDYAKTLFDDSRVHLLENPCTVQLHGVESYIGHGKSLDEILSSVPGMDFHTPERGVELLLKCRHLAPIYGSSTPIAPEPIDRLVMHTTPDIVHMGHIHVHGVRKYKGTTIIASGGWQSQTPFQKRVNLNPDVGIAPILDLQSHQIASVKFNDGLNHGQ